MNSSRSITLLVIVTLVWGTQHAVTKSIVVGVGSSVATLTLYRFLLAAIVSSIHSLSHDCGKEKLISLVYNTRDILRLPVRNSFYRTNAIANWRWGVELGFWMFLGYALQGISLKYTTAQRSGFLLYLNVKFVPFFARLFYGREIKKATWLSAFGAFFGTALLANDRTVQTALRIGDALSIFSAAASAMFILRLESASRVTLNARSLNATCLWSVTVLAFLWVIFESFQAEYQRSEMNFDLRAAVKAILITTQKNINETISAIAYLGLVATFFANYLQTVAQKSITAERACLIYSMDPVYGAIFSYFLLGERLCLQGIIGAGIVFISSVSNIFYDFSAR